MQIPIVNALHKYSIIIIVITISTPGRIPHAPPRQGARVSYKYFVKF